MAPGAKNLQGTIDSSGGGPLSMLRNSRTGRYVFPVPGEHTNWLDEQVAWSKTATMFDQSNHMWDAYFKGPDLKKLLLDVTPNKLANFGRNQARRGGPGGPDRGRKGLRHAAGRRGRPRSRTR